ncbi:MAG: DUF2793 domain-containing protein [Rhodobacteraceae bacterium]|nr:DUF2793 domain-containing protein [Paracoccaceae bacterium]
MARTANLQLPLVQASQAQKHVTVNEAFGLLDGLAQLALASLTTTTPPSGAPDGTAYAIPPLAANEWGTEIGKVAISSNGGWIYVAPRAGWRGWVADTGQCVLFDGSEWVEAAQAVSSNGAASLMQVIEVDVDILAGASVTTAAIIPPASIVLGITGLVTQAVAGTLTGWRLGVPAGSGRYGTSIGLALGASVRGLSGQPQAYYSATPLLIEAEGGNFASGRLRLAAHVFQMKLPRP